MDKSPNEAIGTAQNEERERELEQLFDAEIKAIEEARKKERERELDLQMELFNAEIKAIEEAQNKQREDIDRKKLDDLIVNKYKGDTNAWAKDLEDDINSTAQLKKKKSKCKKKKKKKKKKNIMVAGEEEEEEQEEEEEEGPGPIGEQVKVKSFLVNYGIENCVSEEVSGLTLYKGSKTSSHSSTAPICFVNATESQINNISHLIEISCNNRYIVTVTDLLDSMLVVESGLKPVRQFFQPSAGFHSNGTKAAWWDHISETFKCIFGDFVHGMIHLSSLGERCCHFLVGAKEEGKLLPFMDGEVTERQALTDLITVMSDIITLPFPDSEVDASYNLPTDLMFIFKFLTVDKLDHIPFYWLINQSYFWTSEEKITFIKDFNHLIKQNVLFAHVIDHHLRDTPQGWSSAIGSKDLLSQKEIEAFLRSFFPTIYIDSYEVLWFVTSSRLSSNALSQISETFQRWSRSYFATKGSGSGESLTHTTI